MKTIIRVEPKRNGRGLILFFPETYDKLTDTIEYYSFHDGIHGTASFGYYRECTYFDRFSLTETVLNHIDRYERYIQSLPGGQDERIELRQRLYRK